MNKSKIRIKVLKNRKAKASMCLSIDFKKIMKILKKNGSSNKVIGGYYPYNYEIDTTKILEKLEKLKYKISLPKIRKKSQMNFFNWSTADPLTINKFGIPEPNSNKIVYPSVLLVPIVAYDKHYNRIGYGGGFYDRYISRIRKTKKILTIGLAYSFQKVRKVPNNNNDIRLDFIVTDKTK